MVNGKVRLISMRSDRGDRRHSLRRIGVNLRSYISIEWVYESDMKATDKPRYKKQFRLYPMNPSNTTAKNRREISLVKKVLGRNTSTQPITPVEQEIIDYIEEATFNDLDRALRPPTTISEAFQTDLKNYRRHRRLHLANKIGEIGIPTLVGLIAAAAIALAVIGFLCPAAGLIHIAIIVCLPTALFSLLGTMLLGLRASPYFKNKASKHKQDANALAHIPKRLAEQKRITATIAKTGNKIRKNRERFFKATNSTDSNAADLSVFTRIKYRGLQNRPPTQSINMPEMPATTAEPDLCFEA